MSLTCHVSIGVSLAPGHPQELKHQWEPTERVQLSLSEDLRWLPLSEAPSNRTQSLGPRGFSGPKKLKSNSGTHFGSTLPIAHPCILWESAGLPGGCGMPRLLLLLTASLLCANGVNLQGSARRSNSMSSTRLVRGVDYFNPTFVAPQLTPKQFLIISSASEQKIVYTELKNFKATTGRTFALIDSGLSEPQGLALDHDRGACLSSEQWGGKPQVGQKQGLQGLQGLQCGHAC
eukprot:Skav218409  [mRNA]  locus=scaffold1349:121385:127888:+ [translate_table: standard]